MTNQEENQPRNLPANFHEAVAEAIAQEEKQYQEFLELQMGTKYHSVDYEDEEE